ncbi:MAG: MotA/TolQ/ExbB proton channel family protein [Candidatus Kuenenia sp.]|nr:MotA/TolQ/ExbB proton channel family protein [Candidatus Kuenenia hertensis]
MSEIINIVLKNSGLIGILLLFLWILSVGVIIERSFYWLFLWKRKNPGHVIKISDCIKSGNLKEAYQFAHKSKDIVVRVLGHFLPDIPDEKEINTVAAIAVDKEFGQSHSYLRILNACAVIAPSLGLLGTITGLIKAFGTMSKTADMSYIAGGISEAMATTFLGLVVAIANITAAHIFGGMADTTLSRIESGIKQFRLASLKRRA